MDAKISAEVEAYRERAEARRRAQAAEQRAEIAAERARREQADAERLAALVSDPVRVLREIRDVLDVSDDAVWCCVRIGRLVDMALERIEEQHERAIIAPQPVEVTK